MTSKNASKTGSAAGNVVKPQEGTTLKVMPAPNVLGKPFCVLSHQSGNVLTTPRIYAHSPQYRNASWHKEIKITVTAVNATYQGNISTCHYGHTRHRIPSPVLDLKNTLLPTVYSAPCRVSLCTVHCTHTTRTG